REYLRAWEKCSRMSFSQAAQFFLTDLYQDSSAVESDDRLDAGGTEPLGELRVCRRDRGPFSQGEGDHLVVRFSPAVGLKREFAFAEEFEHQGREPSPLVALCCEASELVADRRKYDGGERADLVCDLLAPRRGALHDRQEEAAVEGHRPPLLSRRFLWECPSGRGLSQSGATSRRSSCLSRRGRSPQRLPASSSLARPQSPSRR